MRFVTKAITFLYYVKKETQSLQPKRNFLRTTSLYRLSLVERSLPAFLVRKPREAVNNVLNERNETVFSTTKLKGVVIFHILTASYEALAVSLTEPKSRTFLPNWNQWGSICPTGVCFFGH